LLVNVDQSIRLHELQLNECVAQKLTESCHAQSQAKVPRRDHFEPRHTSRRH
jgi:hypothetical protein